MSNPIGIVGAGAVAQALGQHLYAAGASMIVVASRSRGGAKRAAAHVGPSVRTVTCEEITRLTDRVIIAVADEGIEPVVQALAAADMTGIVLHTSGASGLAPCAPLQTAGVACGVLHPLQTLVLPSQSRSQFDGVSFGVAGDSQAVEWAEVIVDRLNGNVLRLSVNNLPSYHAGAVMASNALTAAIDAALVLLAEAGLERDVALRAIGPLCRASVENTLRLGPETALTGPVARGDAATVAAHLTAVDHAPKSVAGLYRSTTRHLLSLVSDRRLPSATLRALVQMINVRDVEDCDGQ